MNSPVIHLSHIRFGSESKPILDHLSLEIEVGHFMGIIGPNGAGKSTLLTIIAGLRKPDAGHIDLFGTCLTPKTRSTLQRDLGYLHQAHGGMPDLPMRAAEVVAMGLTEFNQPLWKTLFRSKTKQNALIDEALELVEMTGYKDHDFRKLSGGQQQRIRLARALVRKPKLLLLDEPSAALDSRHQEKLYQLLRKLCDEEKMTVVMVEHDVAAITSYVDSVACLNKHIHYHAKRGESIPSDVWTAMYGDHISIVTHDESCIGCVPAVKDSAKKSTHHGHHHV
ncbi:MAG: metal ABC transporter ATP-binding protein [Zetaproteobacteria bacterium CG2_30_46_52]|nr:MAG: metal ABC transporter ATP-binding protein [Zetaproteobacteria bacterium CG2_30_46_52]